MGKRIYLLPRVETKVAEYCYGRQLIAILDRATPDSAAPTSEEGSDD